MYPQAMTAAPEPRMRLAQYIESRIAELALEYAEVCRLAEISDETLIKIRKGHRARGSTYRKLERALRWQQDSIAAILAGGEPTPVENAAAGHSRAAAEATSPDQSMLSSREMEILEDLATSTAERLGLTSEEAAEALRRARVRIEQKRAAEQEPGEESPGTPRRHAG